MSSGAALDFASLLLPVPAEGYLLRVWSTKVRSQGDSFTGPIFLKIWES